MQIISKPVIVNKPVSVFFVGNSILQVNTTPRVLQYLRNAAQGGSDSETQQPLAFTWTAFLWDGQALATLVKHGMKFGHLQNLNYVIMNDQTQTPARPHLRRDLFYPLRYWNAIPVVCSLILQFNGGSEVSEGRKDILWKQQRHQP
jgi:hypothetical protein